jgi:hypothetical protein
VTRDTWLWIGVTAGPAAWFGDLLLSFVVTPGPHDPWDSGPLLAISIAAFAIALVSTAISWRMLWTTRPDGSPRAKFLAEAGVAMSVLGVLLVAATAVPALMLVPGAEP